MNPKVGQPVQIWDQEVAMPVSGKDSSSSTGVVGADGLPEPQSASLIAACAPHRLADLRAETFVSRDDGSGVEGHARQRRDGTGRCNPVQGILVHGQRQAARLGTLVAPTLAGIEPGLPSSLPADPVRLSGSPGPEMEPIDA